MGEEALGLVGVRCSSREECLGRKAGVGASLGEHSHRGRGGNGIGFSRGETGKCVTFEM